MGRQVEFYMLGQDETEFLTALRAKADVVVISERSSTNQPKILEGFPEIGSKLAREGVVLWNRTISAELVMKEVAPGAFVVDKTDADVIEFRQSEIVDGILRRGRIWMDPNASDENFQPIKKSQEFLKWYDSAARWIRKHFERETRGFYVGPVEKAWLENAGKLQ
jgi:hypothetical protein